MGLILCRHLNIIILSIHAERGTLKMKRIALILALILALPVAGLAEAAPAETSSADEFLNNLSKTWDSFVHMAEDAGQSVSDWAAESGLTEWAEGAANDIAAWANESGLTEWAQSTLSEITGLIDKSGISEWAQENAEKLQAFIDENSPAIEAWLKQADQEVSDALNMLINPEGHTQTEIRQAFETVTDSLSEAGGLADAK